MEIEFRAGYYEWQVVVDGKVFYAFDDLSDDLGNVHNRSELESTVSDLVDDMFFVVQESLDFPESWANEYDAGVFASLKNSRPILEQAMVERLAREYAIE